MNKLLLLCLLSILILYSQCSDCSTGQEQVSAPCSGLEVDEEKKETHKCAKKVDSNQCEEVPICTKATEGAEASGIYHVDNCLGLPVTVKDENTHICAKSTEASDNSACEEVEIPKCIKATEGATSSERTKVKSCSELEVSDDKKNKYICSTASDNLCNEVLLCSFAIQGDSKDGRIKINSCSGAAVSAQKSETHLCVKDAEDEDNKCIEAIKCNKATESETITNGKIYIESCNDAALEDSNKICKKSSNSDCQETTKPSQSNSGMIINAFKITFAFIIIFTIL